MADLVPVNPQNTPKYKDAYQDFLTQKSLADSVNKYQPGDNQWYFNDAADPLFSPQVGDENNVVGAIHPDALMQSRSGGAFTYPSVIDRNTFDQDSTDRIQQYNMGIKQRNLVDPAPQWQFQARADDPQSMARALRGNQQMAGDVAEFPKPYQYPSDRYSQEQLKGFDTKDLLNSVLGTPSNVLPFPQPPKTTG